MKSRKWRMRSGAALPCGARWLTVLGTVLGWLLACGMAEAQIRLVRRPERPGAGQMVRSPLDGVPDGAFAPVPSDHPIAPLWNDPDFLLRLMGSYGFLSEAEPRMTPEEQGVYREQVVPLLGGEPGEAIERVASLVRPEASAVFDFTLGNLHFQAGNLDQAAAWFEQALGKFPDYRRAQRNLALVLVRMERYREAVRPLLRTIALGGGDGRVHGLLAFCYMNEGRHLAAEGAYKQALVYEPENLEFRLGLAKCLLASRQMDPALAVLDELIGEYPEREALWTLQANVYIQKEQPGEAAVTLELLRRMGRATPATLFLLGDLHMAGGNTGLALEAYLSALEAASGGEPVRALRAAEILTSRGHWDEARVILERVRGEGERGDGLESGVEGRLLKLEAKVAMADGDGGESLRILERMVERSPLDAEALLLAGDFHARNGDMERAALRYEAAAKVEGWEAEAWVKHAQLLVQSQRYAQAVELLRRAQRVRPRDNVQRYLEKVEQVARTGAGARS